MSVDFLCALYGTVPFTEHFRSRNCSVHRTVPSRNRSVYSTTKAQIHIYNYRYMLVDFWCALYGTVPFTEPFRLQNCSVHGTVPYILRQKRRYIYISIDICHISHTTVPFTEPFHIFSYRSTYTYFHLRSRSVHFLMWTLYRTVPFTELFRSKNHSVYSTTKAKTHIYKYRYM